LQRIMSYMNDSQNNAAKVANNSETAKDFGKNIDIERAINETVEADNRPQGLRPNQVSIKGDYPEPKYILYRNGIGTMPQGDIVAVKAKQKNGKSFLCTILAASALGCETFGFKTNKQATPTVLYFDTEQNEIDTKKIVVRVHRLLGWDLTNDNPLFRAYSLRAFDTLQRIGFIETEVEALKPTLVFIDGIADLINDFNNVETSNKLIGTLMRLSAENDCCIVCVLHTNKDQSNRNMKGHLGSLLLNKLSDCFEVERSESGDTFKVKETESRHLSIENFAFKIDDHGTPTTVLEIKESKEQKQTETLKRDFSDCFAEHQELTNGALCEIYQNITGVKTRCAQNRISEARQKGILSVVGGMYRLSKEVHNEDSEKEVQNEP